MNLNATNTLLPLSKEYTRLVAGIDLASNTDLNFVIR